MFRRPAKSDANVARTRGRQSAGCRRGPSRGPAREGGRSRTTTDSDCPSDVEAVVGRRRGPLQIDRPRIMVFEFADSWTHIVALRIWLRSALQPDNVLDALRRFADRRANGSIFSVVIAVVLAAVIVVIWNRQAKPAVPLGVSRARRGVQQATMKGPVDQAAPPKPADEPKPVQERSSGEPAAAMDSKPDGSFNPFTNLDDDSPNNTLKVDNAKDSASSHVSEVYLCLLLQSYTWVLSMTGTCRGCCPTRSRTFRSRSSGTRRQRKPPPSRPSSTS